MSEIEIVGVLNENGEPELLDENRAAMLAHRLFARPPEPVEQQVVTPDVFRSARLTEQQEYLQLALDRALRTCRIEQPDVPDEVAMQIVFVKFPGLKQAIKAEGGVV